uniref:Uncharacterized protein n=1 Tax=Rhizophora mucronata TaxID=61149 RepID=A0A2P2N8Y7_RHIMU
MAWDKILGCSQWASWNLASSSSLSSLQRRC